jgi:glycosyltransferase involved in cell wall biosynthesis
MKFSIIVPLYFYDKYVELMFDSLLCQTFTKFEVVIVGNGISNDEFDNICIEIKSKFSNSEIQLKLFYNTEKGANSSRQFGFERSSGDYVFFLDSDDQFSDKNVLHEINEITKDNNVDVVSVNLQHARFKGNELSFQEIVYNFIQKKEFLALEKDKRTILKNFGTNICARFIKKELLKDIHFLTLPYCQDWNVSSKLFFNAKTFYFYQKPCYVWVFRENSISKIDSMSLEKHLNSFNSILDIITYYKKNDIKDKYRFFVNDRIVKFCFQYIGRSSFFDIEEGFKRSNELIKNEVKFSKAFFNNKRIIIMYAMIRFSFLYKLYFKNSKKLN